MLLDDNMLNWQIRLQQRLLTGGYLLSAKMIDSYSSACKNELKMLLVNLVENNGPTK